MIKKFSRQLAAMLALLAVTLPIYALPKASSVPGGIALIPLGAASNQQIAPLAWLGEQPVWVTAEKGQWVAVVGLALDLPPGTHELRIGEADGQKILRFEVGNKSYPEQRVTLKDSSKVNLSAPDEERAVREIAAIQVLKRHWRETGRETDNTDGDFLAPTPGRLISRFGLRRIFNGEPRAPHAGLDLAAPLGTPIRASATGEILAVDDYFFNGKTVFVDHGNGLISMYCHLDQFEVQAGTQVGKGQIIGRSGMTGRANGPHLHWSVILNGVMVDPALFIKTGKQ